MIEDCPTFDPAEAIASISRIVSRNDMRDIPVVVPLEDTKQVVTIDSSRYPNFTAFKQAYLSLKRPALCIARPEELQDVLTWLREGDDVSVVGEPEVLVRWRAQRIANWLASQLDPLTQVYQRSRLVDALDRLGARASLQSPVSLILLDVDHLKSINDQHGPVEGNRLLKQLGGLLQKLCQTVLLARTRGGEFGILLENSEQEAFQVAQVILSTMQQFDWCRYKDVTVSVGVAGVDETETSSGLLSRADAALYAAKANGRNRVVCYHQIAEVSGRVGEDMEVISLEHKARVMSERVTSFVTQQSKMILRNLRREADTDALTQLHNRRYLDRMLEEEFRNARQQGHSLCVALVDLDHFGNVNKQHGWPTGDQVLKEVALMIKSNVRGTDWVGRYGGEELCVVMPGTSLRHAWAVCERIRRKVAQHIFYNPQSKAFSVTFSAGVVEMESGRHADVKALLEDASQRALEAKQGGRNQVCG